LNIIKAILVEKPPKQVTKGVFQLVQIVPKPQHLVTHCLLSNFQNDAFITQHFGFWHLTNLWDLGIAKIDDP
jgi:hypothetical protein